jgi:hypothetical protein
MIVAFVRILSVFLVVRAEFPHPLPDWLSCHRVYHYRAYMKCKVQWNKGFPDFVHFLQDFEKRNFGVVPEQE